MTFKTGQKIKVAQAGGLMEDATIARWTKKRNGPREAMPGWQIVRWQHGGCSMVHETAIRAN